jgi:hypothetical protein
VAELEAEADTVHLPSVLRHRVGAADAQGVADPQVRALWAADALGLGDRAQTSSQAARRAAGRERLRLQHGGNALARGPDGSGVAGCIAGCGGVGRPGRGELGQPFSVPVVPDLDRVGGDGDDREVRSRIAEHVEDRLGVQIGDELVFPGHVVYKGTLHWEFSGYRLGPVWPRLWRGRIGRRGAPQTGFVAPAGAPRPAFHKRRRGDLTSIPFAGRARVSTARTLCRGAPDFDELSRWRGGAGFVSGRLFLTARTGTL